VWWKDVAVRFERQQVDPVSPHGRLLLVDDDVGQCEALTAFLREVGFTVDAVHTAGAALNALSGGGYALVLMDVMLPDMSGFDVLRRVRADDGPPVIMLTARNEESDRVAGLELGADDYVSKPFSPRELAARIRAVLRRTRSGLDEEPPAVRDTVVVGDVSLDPGSRTLRRRGQPMELTSTEFDIAEVLLRHAGQVVTREELARSVYGRESLPEDRGIDMHICHLRRKLRRHQGEPERIKTVRGTGYLYSAPSPDPNAAARSFWKKR
jgi:two-component system response regulator CpxR